MKKLTFDELKNVTGGMRQLRNPEDCIPAFNACEASGGGTCQTQYSLCLNGY